MNLYKAGAYNRGYVAPRWNAAKKRAYIQSKIAAKRNMPVAYVSAAYRANRGLKTEIKTVDTNYSLTGTTDGAVATNLQLMNTIAQDASPTGRIGKKVMMNGVAIRGTLAAQTTLGCTHATILLIYVRNNNQAATLPAWAEILSSQSPISLTNRDGASKFKILRRWDYKCIGDYDSTTPTSETLQIVEEFVKFKKPLEACWTNAGTAGTIGQFEKGSLLLGVVSDQTAASNKGAQFVGNSRVYFSDA